VIKDFVYMTKRIQQGRCNMQFIYGEVVPHHDVLGERSGKVKLCSHMLYRLSMCIVTCCIVY